MKAFLRLLAVSVFLSSPVALVAQTLGPPPGGAPSGAASGDLGGNYPSPTVLNLAHVTGGPPKIIPALDGTAAFQVTKANGTTPVAIFDTTNSALNIGPTQITGSAVRLGVYASATTNAFRAVGDGAVANVLLERYSSDSAANNLTMFKARGSFATPIAVNAADNALVISGSAYDGTQFLQVGLAALTIDTFTTVDNLSSYWTLWTRPDGVGAIAIERMRITKTGGVNVGTYTTDPGAGNLNVTGNYLINGSVNYPSGAVPGFLIINKQVDFSVANADTTITSAIPLPTGYTRYNVQSVKLSGASASINGATASVWCGVGGTGTNIVANATAVTLAVTTENTAANAQNLSLVAGLGTTETINCTTIFFRVQATASGTAWVTFTYQPVS